MWELIFTNDRIVFFFLFILHQILSITTFKFFFLSLIFKMLMFRGLIHKACYIVFFNDNFHFGQIHKLKLIEDIDD